MASGNKKSYSSAKIAVSLASILVLSALGYKISYAVSLDYLKSDSDNRVDIFNITADLIINRLSNIPSTIELNADVVALVEGTRTGQTTDAAQTFLRMLNARLGSEAIFVATERGIVVGSSNVADQDDSRIGADLASRPYYQDALSGFVGRHFSLGAAPDAPGYFVSYPIHDNARVVGVATVKISLKPVMDAFALLGSPALIADGDGIVILASRQDWLYTALKPLTVAERVDLELTGVYGHHRIGAFPIALNLDTEAPALGLDTIVEAAGRDASGWTTKLLVQGRMLEGLDWQLLVFSDLASVHRQARLGAALASVLAGLLVMVVLYGAQRRRIARLLISTQN